MRTYIVEVSNHEGQTATRKTRAWSLEQAIRQTTWGGWMPCTVRLSHEPA